MIGRSFTARACANIALVKYWGKRDAALNLPAAGSLSLTLDALTTVTTVRFDPALAAAVVTAVTPGTAAIAAATAAPSAARVSTLTWGPASIVAHAPTPAARSSRTAANAASVAGCQYSTVGRDVGTTRAALAGYKPQAVQWGMIVLAVATIAAYVAYTVDPHTVEFFATRKLPWSAPFGAIGIGRFAQLALRSGGEDSPTDAMLRDPVFLLNLLAWTVVILAIVY